MESQSKEIYQFEAYQPEEAHIITHQAIDVEDVASRIISDRAYQDGAPVINKSYFFDSSCGMSQLHNADLSNSTIHFKGPVYIDTLQHLNLSNVTLVFNDGIQSVPQKPSHSASGSGAQQPKLTKGQKKAMKRMRESATALPPKAYRSDSELQAAMLTNIENIEQAVHPERLARLSNEPTIKAELPVLTVSSACFGTRTPDNTLPPRPPTPDKFRVGDTKVAEHSRTHVSTSPTITDRRTRSIPAVSAFARADLKRRGVFPTPDTSEEPEPKRVRVETPDERSESPFIKCEGD